MVKRGREGVRRLPVTEHKFIVTPKPLTPDDSEDMNPELLYFLEVVKSLRAFAPLGLGFGIRV